MVGSSPGLFRSAGERITPLAERCRPLSLSDYVGQEHLTGEGKIIPRMLHSGKVFSLILWGDPGTGKTTLANIIAESCDMEYYYLSAISSGVADVRKVIKEGQQNKGRGRQTLLFLDEIHRFNKAQQDAVLGAVESGDIVLIGATTENPSFSVISPLLSRTRVLKLRRLEDHSLLQILDNALENDLALKSANVSFDEGVKEKLPLLGNGDARRMLNVFEVALSLSNEGHITDHDLEEAFTNTMIYYDRKGDRHYDTISAFIKSIRGSDPDGAVYYLAKMILAGEDPEFIARRLVILASEDVGNAAPNALNLAVSTLTAVKNIGMPESEIILAHCTTFLAAAPKSNAAYLAIKEAKEVAKHDNFEVPLYLRNSPTKLMKDMGYKEGYRYPHDYEGHFVIQDYLPRELKGRRFYKATSMGSERAIAERLATLWGDSKPTD